MKQILQSLKTGTVEIAEVPCPAFNRGQMLIRSSRTLVSTGTERMLVEFGKAGLIGKARQQPDKVRQALAKVRVDGLAPTLEAVFNKLDQPLPLGYCNVGHVLEIGAGVTGFTRGDRIVSNGKHAEVVAAPVTLCVKVPDAVSDDEAAFTVLGAIALQGIRLVQPTLGETVVVIGLGLIGLMTLQLLRAAGCRTIGIDRDPDKLQLAKLFGAEIVDISSGADPIAAARSFSRGRGVDAVIIAASTRSSAPVHEAALMSRKRGRIVLVGATGLELSRADFYEKELTFQVSCSYGPGRYDPNYEEKGQDYPIGFVRWTEQRNFEAVLDMLSDGRLNVKPLISHRFPIACADKAYDLITGSEPSLGILLEYPAADVVAAEVLSRRTVELAPRASSSASRAAVGFIGSGNYATSVLIPAFEVAGADLISVVSNTGVSGLHAARKFGFNRTATNVAEIFDDPAISVVVIATRHDSHADLVCRALRAGKHVFVEKPMALSQDEIAAVETAYDEAVASGVAPIVMVGFNRRFAPQAQKIRSLLDSALGPKSFIVTVNAGAIPPDHWTQDLEIGGGRIIGEVCHFIDLLRFLADAPIVAHHTQTMAGGAGDTATISISFADGSIGTTHYFANGSKAFPKERLEAFAGGRILQLDNFRRLVGFGWPNFRAVNLWKQDKGQKACVKAFVSAIQNGGPAPIPFTEALEVSRAAVEIAQASRI